jgi:beta-lactamase superfamily II metal-dependent hydrolase
MRDGGDYRVLLVDTNLDRKVAGVDIPAMMADLLDGQALQAFVNTHPHDDHLCGTGELADLLDIKEVWHTNHKPSKKYGAKHAELTALASKVKNLYGDDAEMILEGSRSSVQYGDAFYHILAPAEYVTDDVNEEDADARRARIHEQCGVIKFGINDTWVIIVGDADMAAFQEHITVYHKDRLPSVVLAAAHHGSRSFFMTDEGDEPYKEGLDAIAPDYVTVSAPTRSESRHDHPHEDAMQLYEDKCGKGNVLHTGASRYCFLTDIYEDGSYGGVQDDQGQLVDEYGLSDDDGGDDKAKAAVPAAAATYRRTRVDDRPMGT